MKLKELEIPEVKLVLPSIHRDMRGFFSETYNTRALTKAGIAARFLQDNHSLSVDKSVVRGLHFQVPPHAQDKLTVKG